MVAEIEWSEQAEESFAAIISYLELNWSEREVVSFIQRVNEKLTLLRSSQAQTSRPLQKHQQG